MYNEIFSQITNAANKRNLRDSTIHAYCTSVAHFLKYTDKPIDALTTDDVDTFLTEKRLSGISPETYNHYHSGIRFFYKKVLKMNWDDDDIPRMKRDRSLPIVLTKAEILLSGKLNDAPSGRLFRADLEFLQRCPSL